MSAGGMTGEGGAQGSGRQWPWGGGAFCKITSWRKCTPGFPGLGSAHRDESLTDAGEQVWPQRVHQQFVLREHGQQQRDSQLGAQALQQLQEAGTAAGNAEVHRASTGNPAHPTLSLPPPAPDLHRPQPLHLPTPPRTRSHT